MKEKKKLTTKEMLENETMGTILMVVVVVVLIIIAIFVK